MIIQCLACQERNAGIQKFLTGACSVALALRLTYGFPCLWNFQTIAWFAGSKNNLWNCC